MLSVTTGMPRGSLPARARVVLERLNRSEDADNRGNSMQFCRAAGAPNFGGG